MGILLARRLPCTQHVNAFEAALRDFDPARVKKLIHDGADVNERFSEVGVETRCGHVPRPRSSMCISFWTNRRKRGRLR
jgi:hypothetical protein